MLKNIKRLEDGNVNNRIRQVTEESLVEVLKVNFIFIFFQRLDDPSAKQEILKQSFASALEGLRTGKMTYSNDPILPLLMQEVKKRTEALKKLSPEE